jgi:hypothetical protein
MKEISNIHLPEQNELKILDNQVNTIDLIKNIIKDPVSFLLSLSLSRVS